MSSETDYSTPLVLIILLLAIIALICLVGVSVHLDATNDLLEQIRDRLPAAETTE